MPWAGWSVRHSLRIQLYLIALLATLLAWIGGGTAMYWSAESENDTFYDRRLADLGQAVLAFSEHEVGERQQALARGAGQAVGDDLHPAAARALGARYQFQIWTADRRLLLRSPEASARLPIVPDWQLGAQELVEGGIRRHVHAEAGPGGTVIHVGELQHDRQSWSGTLRWTLVSLFLLTFGATALLSARLLNAALTSLREVSADLSSRDETDLRPLGLVEPPQELEPVVAAVNQLFQRIQRAFDQERGFTAVAAHEMRTPLAALRMQAQVALRSRDEAGRRAALDQLVAGVDRCAHLLDQLLLMARIDDAESMVARICPLDWAEITAEALADVASEAERRDIDVQTRLQVRSVEADPVGLQALMRNLLANAIAHSPKGGQVRVDTWREGDATLLQIDDGGPGIAPEDRDRVFARFLRLRQEVRGGAGLGLSIVQAVVKAHGATVSLETSTLGGLRVRVRWPQLRLPMPGC